MSFEDFYRRYGAWVRSLAVREFGEPDADDIVQEAMIRAYRGYDDLADPERAWRWLVTLTRRAGIDVKRKKCRLVCAEADMIERMSPALPDEPVAEALACDTFRQVDVALGKVSDGDRRAFTLHAIHGLSIAEVARTCGMTAVAARQRIFRARRLLSRELASLAQPVLAPFPVMARRCVGAVRQWTEGLASIPVTAHDGAPVAVAVLLGVLAGGPANVPVVTPQLAPPSGSLGPGAVVPPVPSVRLGAPASLRLGLPEMPAGTSLPADPSYQYRHRHECAAFRGFDATCAVADPLADPDVPDGAERLDGSVSSAGGVTLAARALLPPGRAPGERHPAVLVVGPGTQTPQQYTLSMLWRDGRIFDRRIAYAEVTLRGRGGSGGCADFGGDDERADVVAAVEWAASQPWSNGRVVLWGASYSAWAALMGVHEAPPSLAGAVVGSPLTSTYRGLFMDGVPYAHRTWPLLHVRQGGACAHTDLAAMQDADSAAPYWRKRDLGGRPRRDVPVFFSHGFGDPVVMPDNAAVALGALGNVQRGFVGQFRHGFPPLDHWLTDAMNWVDVRLGVAPRGEVRGIDVQQGPNGVWRNEPAWPPPDATPLTMPLRGGTYRDVSGNYGSPEPGQGDPCAGPATACGAGVWTFGRPLPYDVHLAGTPVVRARMGTLSPLGAPLVALLYDIGPDGRAQLDTRGATVARTGELADVSLYPQDWRLAAGHRLAVLLTGLDETWFAPAHSGGEVTVEAAELEARFLRYDRSAGTWPDGEYVTSRSFTVAVTGETELPLPPPMVPRENRRRT